MWDDQLADTPNMQRRIELREPWKNRVESAGQARPEAHITLGFSGKE